MSAELKPCPFCGSSPEVTTTMDEDIWSHNTVPWTRVECSQCEIGTGFRCEGFEPSAIEAWNQRAGETQ
ncbi:putative Restriction alleviation and modification enhancement protein [Cupriavidus phytorum]|uniref:Restriction alleviation and modification enhancement protein n=1 Tax=Cupriavidus taiwanensis TaxID=164546 RepID=A0A375C8R5_9BURK|nr:putative Restriction alleviation and modification enhancement protein [Cupriavidus taiwanensis]